MLERFGRPVVVSKFAAALAFIAACAPPDPMPVPDDVDISIAMHDIYFEPDGIEVQAGQTTTVHLANEGGIVHDLVFDGFDSGEVRPGRSTVVELGPLTDNVIAWCSIPGHRAAGMELEITVVS